MILLVDNYDSFTFNLYQLLAGAGRTVRVVRNDALDPDQVLDLAPSAVVLSPGPGRPGEAGLTPRLLSVLPADTPVLGVCLGHQALVEHEGGTLEVDPAPLHGKRSAVEHTGEGLFADLPRPLVVGRYHSLRARREDLPAALECCAWTAEGHVMAVRHRELPRHGLQFHPESILTPEGPRLVEHFLRLVPGASSAATVAAGPGGVR